MSFFLYHINRIQIIAAPATNIPHSRVTFEISPVFGIVGSVSDTAGVGVTGDRGTGLSVGAGLGASPGVLDGTISVSG